MDLLHNSFFYISPSTSTALYQRQTRATSFTFDNFVITPKPFPMAGIFEGSKEVEIWGSKIWAVWWWGGKVHLCFHLQRTSPYRATFTSPCALARKSILFRGALITSGIFRIPTKKNQGFPVDLTEVYEVLHNILGNPGEIIRIVRHCTILKFSIFLSLILHWFRT